MFKKFLCVAFAFLAMSLAFISNVKAETKLGELEDVTINIDKSSEKKIGNNKYVIHVGEFSVDRTGVGSISTYIDTRLKNANYCLTYLIISSKDNSRNTVQKIKVPFMNTAMSFNIAMNKELIYELDVESSRRIIKNPRKDKFKINISAGGFSSGNDDSRSMFVTNAGNEGTSEFTTVNFADNVKDEGKGGYVAVYSGDDYMYPITSYFSKSSKDKIYEIKVRNRFEKTNTILIVELEQYEIERDFKNK